MFNGNKKLLSATILLSTIKIAWISSLLISCFRYVEPESQHYQLQSEFIDYDCDESTNGLQVLHDSSFLRWLNEKKYFSDIISAQNNSNLVKKKLAKCVRQNFVKSDRISNENFEKFTTYYFKTFYSFEIVNDTFKRATNNRVDFYKILDHLNENQQLFKQTIVKLYNVLAKLIGPKIVPYLIFDLMVVNHQHQANNALATAIAYSVNKQVVKSCIVYSKDAINFTYDELLKNYLNIIWSSANEFHPIIHEFAHSLDYFTRMSWKNRMNLPYITSNSNNIKCNNNDNQNILNLNVGKNELANTEKDSTFSTAAFDLQEYLFVNIRNHQLENNKQSKKMLASLIVPSEYGNEDNRSEFFAEAFVYWYATVENKRGRNWQILNRFFLEYFKSKYYLN